MTMNGGEDSRDGRVLIVEARKYAARFRAIKSL
jgi:hypothetical protein